MGWLELLVILGIFRLTWLFALTWYSNIYIYIYIYTYIYIFTYIYIYIYIYIQYSFHRLVSWHRSFLFSRRPWLGSPGSLQGASSMFSFSVDCTRDTLKNHLANRTSMIRLWSVWLSLYFCILLYPAITIRYGWKLFTLWLGCSMLRCIWHAKTLPVTPAEALTIRERMEARLVSQWDFTNLFFLKKNGGAWFWKEKFRASRDHEGQKLEIPRPPPNLGRPENTVRDLRISMLLM